jgi:hypothetical protein
LSLILLFSFCQQPQPGIPFRLECIRYETVARVHFHVPSFGHARFVTGSLDLCLSQAISFFEPSPDFVLNSQRYFQRHWGDAAKQQLAHRIVDCLSGDVLTRQMATIEVLTGTHIVGPQTLAAGGVTRVHPLPTDAAHN